MNAHDHFDYLKNARNVAVIRLDEIGDMVMTSAFLRELRRNLPNARITLAVNPTVFNLVEKCPYVDRIIAVPVQKRGGGFGDASHAASLVALAARQWWNDPPDLAILPRWGADMHQARLLSWLIGARWRIGFDEPGYRQHPEHKLDISGPGFLNCVLPATGDPIHQVKRSLGLLQAIGGSVFSDDLELWITPQDVRKAHDVLPDGERKLFIAICAAARHFRKQWPMDRFATVIERLLASNDSIQFLIVGGPDDFAKARSLGEISSSRVMNLCGKLTLRESAAVLQKCALYIGNDTGPMHIAAAAGTSVVETSCHPIQGDQRHENSPLQFGPWKTPSVVLQPDAVAPCSAGCEVNEPHCILGVSVDDVLAAANLLLAKRAVGEKSRHVV